MDNIETIIKKNLGSTERMMRLTGGLILIGVGLYLFGGKNGEKIGIIIALSGVLPILTGLLNYCPLYSVKGLKKRRER